jgi:hypothetical protein
MKNLKYIITVLFLAIALRANDLIAQPPPPPSFNLDVDDTGAPINGLIGLAILVGVYFGVWKLKDKK